MVRVISVHNFPKQNVSSVNDVSAVAVTHTDTLLLGQCSHNIAIRSDDESQQEKYLSTVDQPISVEYSIKGNYIATLEARGDVKCVRVYLSWELADGVSPLRARIAGIVTPLSQFVPGVEMLEVPTTAMPECIAVCPFSGNLIVASGDVINVFKYVVQRHDISKFDFADFFKTKWNIQLSFVPTNIKICEDIIAVHNDRYLAVVSVHTTTPSATVENRTKPAVEKYSGPIDYNKLIESPELYDVDFRTHVFPSVADEPQIFNTPFLPFSGVAAKLVFDSIAKKETVDIKTLLQVQLADCVISSSARRDLTETFACVKLTPYYLSTVENSCTVPTSPLGSQSFSNLFAVSCFFGTQQEGYHYHYLCKHKKFDLVSVYPFTAPLQDAVVDDGLLHALTDAGLETYTLRVPVYGERATVSDQNDPICLVGLRQFVHVRHLKLGSQSLFLIASQDSGSPCTVYNLSLAETGALWGDFLAAAEENRWEAPSTYVHLVKEANLILRSRRERLLVSKQIKGLWNEERFVLVDSLYKQSCAVLADYYLLHDEFEESFKMYQWSELKLTDVVRRIQSLYNDVPAEYRPKFDEETLNTRLLHYVKEAVRQEDTRYNSFGDNREEFYTPDVSSFVSVVLDVLEKYDKTSVSTVVLSSPVIQQFGSDKSLIIFDALDDPKPSDSLALAIMHLQKGKTDIGLRILATLDHEELKPLLLTNSHLLWESDTSPSELTATLLQLNPQFVAGLLSTCADQDIVPFTRIQKMFTQLLQNGGLQSKNAADVLEEIIEDQLETYTSKRHLTMAIIKDAVNSLSCLYLTRLSQRRETSSERVIFRESRPKYLDQLPPFASDFSHVLSPQHSPSQSEDEPKNVLIKLQSLLGDEIARDSLYKMRLLLWQTPKVYGCLSIHVQCAGAAEAAQMLVNFAPHALLAYLKEVDLDELAWSNVIEQIQYKISSATEAKRKLFYEQLLNSLLEHLAQKLSLQNVADLLPMDHPNRNHILRMTYNHEQAQQVRSMIMLTGDQLL